MRAVVQRVSRAIVSVNGNIAGEIGMGLLVLLGVGQADAEADAVYMAEKISGLRIFEDELGKMNRSVQDVPAAGLLIVSQFTLAADTSGGNRPSFTGAAPPELGRQLFEAVLRLAAERHSRVASGRFGADMQVHLVNDGPVTIPMTVR